MNFKKSRAFLMICTSTAMGGCQQALETTPAQPNPDGTPADPETTTTQKTATLEIEEAISAPSSPLIAEMCN